MREIKFRTWDSIREEMYYGYTCYNPVPTGYMELEIMQYTGLKDKSDKEIYEGDIFHLGDKNIKYIVVWDDTGFKGKQHKSSSYVGLEYRKDRIEVIGNIHENKELLEVK